MSLWAVISWLIKALSGGLYRSYSAVRSFELQEEPKTWEIDNVNVTVKKPIISLNDQHTHSKSENSVNWLTVE